MRDVSTAVIRQDGRILICQRPPHKGNALKWEFVGGKSEDGETLEETLTPDEVKGLKELVGLYRLHTNSNYYKVVEKTLAEQLYKEFNKGE